MTKEEKHLWYDFLKKLPVTVNRQKVIGDFVVDFYCASAKLVIELDGLQHSKTLHLINDAHRDAFLNNLGITVLRFSNHDIYDHFELVCAEINRHIKNVK